MKNLIDRRIQQQQQLLAQHQLAQQQLIAQQKRESRIQTTHVYSWGRNDFGQLGHQQ